jgi:hypothetical protein
MLLIRLAPATEPWSLGTYSPMTAVHPTTFKQQVAKKRRKICETEVHPLRYASGRTYKQTNKWFISDSMQAFIGMLTMAVIAHSANLILGGLPWVSLVDGSPKTLRSFHNATFFGLSPINRESLKSIKWLFSNRGHLITSLQVFIYLMGILCCINSTLHYIICFPSLHFNVH